MLLGFEHIGIRKIPQSLNLSNIELSLLKLLNFILNSVICQIIDQPYSKSYGLATLSHNPSVIHILL